MRLQGLHPSFRPDDFPAAADRARFDPELLFLAKKFGFKVAEVPVAWAHREGTRLSPLRDGVRMFAEMLRIRWYALSGKYAAPG
jgi:hypothetical protein